MSTQKTAALLIVAALLGGAAWYYTGPYQKSVAHEQSARTNEGILEGFNAERLTKVVVVTADGETHTLVKNNAMWYAQPGMWPTETIITGALEEKLGEMAKKPLTVASVNPKYKSQFEVDAANGMQVTLFEGDTRAAEFIVGKVSSDYSGTYISREGDDKTYITPVTLVRAFDVESWRDRTVTNINDKAIDTVVLDYAGQQPVTLTTKEDTSGEIYWRMSAPGKLRLNAGKVAEWLPKLAKLEARDIPPQDVELVRQLTLTIKGQGIDEQLVIGQKDPETGWWYIKQESTGRVFLITDEDKRELFKQVKDLQ